MNETEYPECEKMAAVNDQSQKIGEFIEWLRSEKDLEICEWNGGDYFPARFSTEKLLSEFFNIDLDTVEEEKYQMLDELRRKG